MNENSQASWDKRERLGAELSGRGDEALTHLAPGMTVTEARRLVASYDGLSLMVVDADNPVMTADIVRGRVTVFARDGVLVSLDD